MRGRQAGVARPPRRRSAGQQLARFRVAGVRLADDGVAGRDRRDEIAARDRVEGEREVVRAEHHHRAAEGGVASSGCWPCVSIVAWHHERSLAAAAPWRSWLVVRGSSTCRRRGLAAGRSRAAASSTSASAARFDLRRVVLEEGRGRSGRGGCAAPPRRRRPRARRARRRPRPTRDTLSARGASVAGSTAENDPQGDSACRHSPSMRTGSSVPDGHGERPRSRA